MKIDNASSSYKLRGLRSRGAKSRASSFSLSDAEHEQSSVSTFSGAGASSYVDGLVSLQMIDGVEVDANRKKNIQQMMINGEELLDQLDEIRVARISGHIPAHVEAKLNAILSRMGEKSGDPRLDKLIEQIVLRVKVELARIERHRSKN